MSGLAGVGVQLVCSKGEELLAPLVCHRQFVNCYCVSRCVLGRLKLICFVAGHFCEADFFDLVGCHTMRRQGNGDISCSNRRPAWNLYVSCATLGIPIAKVLARSPPLTSRCRRRTLLYALVTVPTQRKKHASRAPAHRLGIFNFL